MALDTLYREQSPRLLKSLARRTANAEEARDLVQEIFCRLARLGTATLQSVESPQAYLSRMATNLLRDRAKTASRRMLSSHVTADKELLVGTDQQRLLEARDTLRRVEAAVLRLRPKTREIFMAHRVEGLSYAEIAQRMGLSVKGVEKQMSKAIANVRSRSLDPVLMRENWLSAYDYATERASLFLGEYARADDPFAEVGRRTVSVQVTSVVRASDSSFRVAWTESEYERGSLASTSRWTAMLTVKIRPPRVAEVLRKNPLGLYVDAIDWSRELEAPVPGPVAGSEGFRFAPAMPRSPAASSTEPLDPSLVTSEPSQSPERNTP